MWRLFLYISASLLLALVPVAVGAADLEITEVMYDAEGADSGREWLEVYNTTNSSIELTEWHFYENETNHGLSERAAGAETALGANSYAVIAADPEKFLADYPSFSGVVVDSAFALSNSGEELALRMPADVLVASVRYEPQSAADGTGGSLQLSAGEWIAAGATPGDTNRQEADNPSGEGTDGNDEEDEDESFGDHELLPQAEDDDHDRDITVDAGTNKTEVAGVAIEFSGTFEEDGEVSEKYEDEARWSFGNGAMRHGAEVGYAYPHAGTYVATLSLEEGDEMFKDAVAVEVLPQQVSISAVTGSYVELASGMSADIDLGGWRLSRGGSRFTLPEDTVLLSGGVLKITHAVSGLGDTDSVELSLPDGTVATSSSPEPAGEDATSSQAEASTTIAAASEDELLFGASQRRPTPQVAGQQTTQSPAPTPAPAAASPAPTGPTPPPAAGNTPTPPPSSSADSTANAASTQTATSVDMAAVLSPFTAQAAAAGGAGFDPGMFWQWALLLVMLCVGAVVAVLFLRRSSTVPSAAETASENYKIEEL